jgi:hypothetical protein
VYISTPGAVDTLRFIDESTTRLSNTPQILMNFPSRLGQLDQPLDNMAAGARVLSPALVSKQAGCLSTAVGPKLTGSQRTISFTATAAPLATPSAEPTMANPMRKARLDNKFASYLVCGARHHGLRGTLAALNSNGGKSHSKHMIAGQHGSLSRQGPNWVELIVYQTYMWEVVH